MLKLEENISCSTAPDAMLKEDALLTTKILSPDATAEKLSFNSNWVLPKMGFP